MAEPKRTKSQEQLLLWMNDSDLDDISQEESEEQISDQKNEGR